jgi:hypothetical protein
MIRISSNALGGKINIDRSRAIAYRNLGDAYARGSERDKERAA